jgi:peptidoglycan hydrolase-like protein with peptidoglycan-binding domain
VQVTKIASPPATREIEIPAEYRTVTRREKVSDGRMAWRQTLCETNTSGSIVYKLQRALKNAGFDPGRIDGVIGPDTMGALKRYQSAKGLPQGGLTLETLKSLDVL